MSYKNWTTRGRAISVQIQRQNGQTKAQVVSRKQRDRRRNRDETQQNIKSSKVILQLWGQSYNINLFDRYNILVLLSEATVN